VVVPVAPAVEQAVVRQAGARAAVPGLAVAVLVVEQAAPAVEQAVVRQAGARAAPQVAVLAARQVVPVEEQAPAPELAAAPVVALVVRPAAEVQAALLELRAVVRVAAPRLARAAAERRVRRPGAVPVLPRLALPAETARAPVAGEPRVAVLPVARPAVAAAMRGLQNWLRAMRFCAAWRRRVHRPRWRSARTRASPPPSPTGSVNLAVSSSRMSGSTASR
jgi:hypothetical protein